MSGFRAARPTGRDAAVAGQAGSVKRPVGAAGGGANAKSVPWPSHMIDAAFSGRRDVKPGFDGRLDSAPPVRDLRAQGFPLLGRSEDYVDGKSLAMFIYGRGGGLARLFRRPVRRDQWPARVVTRRGGFNILWWSYGTCESWAVSEVLARDLLQNRTLTPNLTNPRQCPPWSPLERPGVRVPPSWNRSRSGARVPHSFPPRPER